MQPKTVCHNGSAGLATFTGVLLLETVSSLAPFHAQVRNVDEAAAYRQRILAAVPQGVAFEPLMTLYLTGTLPVCVTAF